MKYKAWLFIVHLTACIAFLSIPLILAPGPPSFNSYASPITREETLAYVFLLIFFYINFYFFIPELYFQKRKNTYVGVIVMSMLICSLLPRIIIPNTTHFNSHPPFFNLFAITHNVFLFLTILFSSLMLRISNQLKITRQEKLATELNFLKLQMNPHFLFNSLNSIYSLAIQKSDDTPSAVVTLSGMMRYVLTEATHNVVELEKEISYLTNYIQLQRLRLEETTVVDYSVHGSSEGKEIVPMLFITFVENAFKHGVNPEQPSPIKIHITITPSLIHLHVHNLKVCHAVHSTGMGINNAKKRLELAYPDKHLLTICDTQTDYTVDLKINYYDNSNCT
jgi:LytS/YehU family sensor histidine kinase